MDPDTPIGDALDADDGEQDTAPNGEMIVVDGSATCDDCVHQDVCAVYANFAPQVEREIPERTGGEPAFEADQLAIICEHYMD